LLRKLSRAGYSEAWTIHPRPQYNYMPQQEPSKEEKIYNLVIELEIAKRNKRDTVKAHNEEVKRIQSEIKDLLTDNQALE